MLRGSYRVPFKIIKFFKNEISRLTSIFLLFCSKKRKRTQFLRIEVFVNVVEVGKCYGLQTHPGYSYWEMRAFPVFMVFQKNGIYSPTINRRGISIRMGVCTPPGEGIVVGTDRDWISSLHKYAITLKKEFESKNYWTRR